MTIDKLLEQAGFPKDMGTLKDRLICLIKAFEVANTNCDNLEQALRNCEDMQDTTDWQ